MLDVTHPHKNIFETGVALRPENVVYASVTMSHVKHLQMSQWLESGGLKY